MADNPYYVPGAIRHYLEFVDPDLGVFEIEEPVKFDAFSLKLKQPPNRFGRDKTIGGEEIDLEFWAILGGTAEIPYTLQNGTVVYHLSHQLDKIFEAVKRKGSEATVIYKVTKDGAEWRTGEINFPESKTDNYTEFRASIIQDTTLAVLERKKEIEADVFSSTDTFGNPIVPLISTKVLLKAKPFYQVSRWESSLTPGDHVFVLENRANVNWANIVKSYGIDDTQSYIQGGGNPFEFKYIFADNELTNVKIKLTNIVAGLVTPPDDVLGTFNGDLTLTVKVGIDNDPGNFVQYDLQTIVNDTVDINSSFELDLPLVKKGEYIVIYFHVSNGDVFARFGTMNVEISATSTSIDSVINAVPYFDYCKQGVKSLCGLGFEAPEFETGEFKNQFVTSGYGMRQLPNKPLKFIFKDEAADLMEFCADYQILSDEVQFLTYPYFYANIELAKLLQLPTEKQEEDFNDRFKINQLNFRYNKYEQNKDELNTIDAFNTETQKSIPNTKVGDKLEVEVGKIRDANKIEFLRRRAVDVTTSLDDDDSVCIIDCISVAPNTQKSFSAALQMRVINPESEGAILQILSDNFSWLTIGQGGNGTIVTIEGDENSGTYSILQQNETVLELVTTDGTPPPTFTGTKIITYNYVVSGVIWTNRTNEGFDLIENITTPDKISNLHYSIGQNLNRNGWQDYLHTICGDIEEKSILTTSFKANGELTTRFQGGKIIKENAPIVISDLVEKTLSKKTINFECACDFATALYIFEQLPILKGYITIYDANMKMRRVHPQLLDYNFSTGILTGNGEIRNESDYVTLTSISGGVRVEEVGYDVEDISLNWYAIYNGYVQIFDALNRPVINETYFTFVKINGVLFTDEVLFAAALSSL